MTPPPSPPLRPGRNNGPFDYDHGFHAGNVGDVFKHCALRAWVEALQGDGALHLLDTHAGAGVYKLPAQGEWLEGIGRLDAAPQGEAPRLVRQYLEAVGSARQKGKGGLYLGSPAFLRALLRPQDRLTLFELMDEPRQKLATHYASDEQVVVSGCDGLAGLVDAAKGSDQGRVAAFVDPPYVAKAEWSEVVQRCVEAKRACAQLAICVWYPIKSPTRPQAMRNELRDAGLGGASIDLISTPLRLKRKRLNGSGLLFIDPPAGLLATLGEAAPWLGQVLASEGEWTTSTTAWPP